ncbi:helix-turn-helix transcriptional regulator [Nocardia aurantia]|uniref:HTH luxR-type domain-containing protein n=1 Tax=Nocardia aurantia TaxID=2585199 RepID=A0A7K0DZC8_9NOCA|nr:AAA family ATPase [Nocardia aurantia]MQY31166.1 hypothetical protein [Nocardia aurantia]
MSVQVRTPVSRELPLVGRDDECAALRRLLGDCRDTAVGAAILLGQAGLGKSRVLAATVAGLAADGWVVLDVRADRLDRLVPYACLRHAIDRVLPDLPPDAAAAGRALVTAFDLVAERPTASVRAAAARFCSAVTGSRPVALAFDELAEADDDTVVLLGHLLRLRGEHPMVLVGNLRCRDGAVPPTVTRLLERLDADHALAEVRLGPLPDPDIDRIARTLAGGPLDASELETIRRWSEGNPLFAIEATLTLCDGAAGAGTTDIPTFAEDRRRSFLHRVLRVGPEAASLSRAVALLRVVGQGRVDLAAELAGLTPEQAVGAFDVLVDQGILRLRERHGYSVSHDLVREALYQEIGPATRWRWHRLAAQRLSALPSTPGVDFEVADHIRRVAEVGDDQAITMLTRAAERACEAAPQSSIGWYRTAIGIVPVGDPRRTKLLADLSRALLLAARPEESVEAGLLALDGIPDGPARTRLAIRIVDGMVLAGAMDDAAALVDAEVPRSGGNPVFTARAAHIRMGVGRADEALESAALVTDSIPRLHPHDRIVALGHLMRMRFVERRLEPLRRLCTAMEDAARAASQSHALAAHAVVAYAHAGTGETELASASIARAQWLLATVGWTLYSHDLATAAVQNALHLGDWSSALAIIDSISHDLVSTGSRTHLAVLRATEIEIRSHRGEWAAARRAADRPPAGDAHSTALQIWARAGFHLLGGELDIARKLLADQLEHPGTPQWAHALLRSRSAEVEISAGHRELAADLVRDLVTADPDRVDHPTAVAIRIAYGRATADVECLLDARRIADRYGLALQRGVVRLALGAVDHEPGPQLTEAARIFQSLGAAPWKRQAVAELRHRGLPLPRSRTRRSYSLTETEEQIVRLVHQRYTNREIAAAVFLSVKTVEAYLSRIYLETGCANRVELARAVESGRVRVGVADHPA